MLDAGITASAARMLRHRFIDHKEGGERARLKRGVALSPGDGRHRRGLGRFVAYGRRQRPLVSGMIGARQKICRRLRYSNRCAVAVEQPVLYSVPSDLKNS